MSSADQATLTKRLLDTLMGAPVAHALYVATKFGFADHLASEPKTSTELARLSNAHASSVLRLLRALAGSGLFVELDDGRFANTPLSELLRTDTPNSMRNNVLFLHHDIMSSAWTKLGDTIGTGKPSFDLYYGEELWQYLWKHPEVGAVFDAGMTSLSTMYANAVANAYDFEGIGTVCDVGGGRGILLGTILTKYPRLRGILFDQPQVVASVGEGHDWAPVKERCQVVGGNFFESVPEADAYVLKSVIHDWSDEDAVRILKTVHKAAKPGQTLLLFEAIVQPGNEPDDGKILDLFMMVMTSGGRERTEKEFATILNAAGFDLVRVIPTQSNKSILESRRR
ncbi:acetylserotonin O-methyltransferase [Pendulispora rubella]|uniref:Acetylserotonin O-methyltransferase n=1 Tax=Pendulispora rubella TaxID=2741070 RepID=A0ABZ2KP29_9BACT